VNAQKPRFFIDSLTGYSRSSGGAAGRKPTTTWSVYDRVFNCRQLACFFGADAEARARRYAEQLNLQEEEADAEF